MDLWTGLDGLRGMYPIMPGRCSDATVRIIVADFDGLEVVREQPPAIRGQFRHCDPGRRTKAGHPHHVGCPYRQECAENVNRGGMTFCETGMVVAAGGGERTL